MSGRLHFHHPQIVSEKLPQTHVAPVYKHLQVLVSNQFLIQDCELKCLDFVLFSLRDLQINNVPTYKPCMDEAFGRESL